MSERRTGADRPAADDEDTLIRTGDDFYGSTGAPTRNPALSRDREERPASPAQPRATGATPGRGGLTQKGQAGRRPTPPQRRDQPRAGTPGTVQPPTAATQATSRDASTGSASTGSAVQAPGPRSRGPQSSGRPSSGRQTAGPRPPSRPAPEAQEPRERASGRPAAVASRPQATPTTGQPGPPTTPAALSGGVAADRPPTRAERIMRKLPPPPESQRRQQVRADEARSLAGRPEARGPDDAPTHLQPRVPDLPRADPVSSAAISGSARSSVSPAAVRPSAYTASPAARVGNAPVQARPAGPVPPRSGGSASGVAESGREAVERSGRPHRRTRRARLRLARVDPWSVMKTFFLFSIAAGVMACVSVAVVWTVIESSGLFERLEQLVRDVLGAPGDETPFTVSTYLNWRRVMATTVLLSILDVVILTALATLGAFLYNLAATMLGGLEVTLAED